LHVLSRGSYVQIRLLNDKIYRYSIAVGWIRRAGSPAVASYRGQKPITFPAPHTLFCFPFSRVKILFFDKIFLLIIFWAFLSLYPATSPSDFFNLLIKIFWSFQRPEFAEFEYDVVKGAEWLLESNVTESLQKLRKKIAHFTFLELSFFIL